MKNKSMITGYTLVVASAVIFGLMPLMAKYIYLDGVNGVSLVLLRNLFSLPFLALLTFLTGGSLKINPRALPSISLIALMGCSVTPALLFCSYNYIPSGTATVFHFIYPAAVLVGEFFFLKNKMSKGHLVSVILCVLGIALFYDPKNTIDLRGAALALASGVTYAIYIIGLAVFKYKEISGFAFSFYVSLISSAMMLPFCLITGGLTLPASLTGWGLTVFFAVAINVGAVVLFQRGTFIIGGGRAAILSTFEPITSILAGFFVFEEHLGIFTLIGSALVIAASVMIAVFDMKRKS